MHTNPLISILTPVYNTEPGVLAEAVESVLQQSYQRWQLCLVDDCSPNESVWAQLQQLATTDPRIFIQRRETNGGIVAASQDCAAMATGGIIALLDHDDLLHPSALTEIARAFNEFDDVDYVYTDEDLINEAGKRVSPFFKPDWSPERFRGQMYTCHLSAFRKSLFDEVGGFREGFDGSQDWDLVLRITERARRITHISRVLYHWRIGETSVLAGDHVKPYAYDSARKALQEHCERIGIHGEVVELERRGHFRVKRHLVESPLVSIVIPTCGSRGIVGGQERVMVEAAVQSVLERCTYENLEVLVVFDSHTPTAVLMNLREVAGDRLRLLEWEKPFDFSAKCNLGAAYARGERLVFLNDDIEVITPDWVETMLGFLQESDVGAAGAHLLFEDGRLQHGGHVHLNGAAGHLMFGQNPKSDKNRMALWLDREVAGVTAAAMMVRRDVFDEVGGFSPLFANNYNDVDFCCKVRSAGYRIIVTPHAQLYHFESVTRDPSVTPAETAAIQGRWLPQLRRDPYYNPKHVGGLDSYPEPIAYPSRAYE